MFIALYERQPLDKNWHVKGSPTMHEIIMLQLLVETFFLVENIWLVHSAITKIQQQIISQFSLCGNTQKYNNAYFLLPKQIKCHARAQSVRVTSGAYPFLGSRGGHALEVVALAEHLDMAGNQFAWKMTRSTKHIDTTHFQRINTSACLPTLNQEMEVMYPIPWEFMMWKSWSMSDRPGHRGCPVSSSAKTHPMPENTAIIHRF